MMKQTLPTKTSFLNPEELLKSIPLEAGTTIADFGCGNGYYAVAAGSQIGSKGKVYAVDILEEALSQTSTLARLAKLNNIYTIQCNLERFGTCRIADTSCDLVIVASLLHQVEQRAAVVKEAYRVLKTGGKVLVVEWKPEARFGPLSAVRIEKNEVQKIFIENGFRPFRELDAGIFHYAGLYIK